MTGPVFLGSILPGITDFAAQSPTICYMYTHHIYICMYIYIYIYTYAPPTLRPLGLVITCNNTYFEAYSPIITPTSGLKVEPQGWFHAGFGRKGSNYPRCERFLAPKARAFGEQAAQKHGAYLSFGPSWLRAILQSQFLFVGWFWL